MLFDQSKRFNCCGWLACHIKQNTIFHIVATNSVSIWNFQIQSSWLFSSIKNETWSNLIHLQPEQIKSCFRINQKKNTPSQTTSQSISQKEIIAIRPADRLSIQIKSCFRINQKHTPSQTTPQSIHHNNKRKNSNSPIHASRLVHNARRDAQQRAVRELCHVSTHEIARNDCAQHHHRGGRVRVAHNADGVETEERRKGLAHAVVRARRVLRRDDARLKMMMMIFFFFFFFFFFFWLWENDQIEKTIMIDVDVKPFVGE